MNIENCSVARYTAMAAQRDVWFAVETEVVGLGLKSDQRS